MFHIKYSLKVCLQGISGDVAVDCYYSIDTLRMQENMYVNKGHGGGGLQTKATYPCDYSIRPMCLHVFKFIVIRLFPQKTYKMQ